MIPRTFTAYQALARGAMTVRELAHALGCTHQEATRTIDCLRRQRSVRTTSRRGCGRFVYEVVR